MNIQFLQLLPKDANEFEEIKSTVRIQLSSSVSQEILNLFFSSLLPKVVSGKLFIFYELAPNLIARYPFGNLRHRVSTGVSSKEMTLFFLPIKTRGSLFKSFRYLSAADDNEDVLHFQPKITRIGECTFLSTLIPIMIVRGKLITNLFFLFAFSMCPRNSSSY